jgi:hypothetical protein
MSAAVPRSWHFRASAPSAAKVCLGDHLETHFFDFDAWLLPAESDLLNTLARTKLECERLATYGGADKARGAERIAHTPDAYAVLANLAATLALGWQSALKDAAKQRLENALRDYRRPRGRPRKFTLGDMARGGLLGNAPKKPSKRGRKATASQYEKNQILALVLRTKDRLAEATGRIAAKVTDKEAIEAIEREFPNDKPLALHKQRRRVERIGKLVSKYRRELGMQLRPRKSRNSC